MNPRHADFQPVAQFKATRGYIWNSDRRVVEYFGELRRLKWLIRVNTTRGYSTLPSGHECEEQYAQSTISGPKLTSQTNATANGNMSDAADVDVTLNGNAGGVTLVILTGWSHS